MGLRIVVEIARRSGQVVLNNLYKHTQLQTSFGANMLSIVDGVPRTLRLDQMIRYYVNHQPRRHRPADHPPAAQGQRTGPTSQRSGQGAPDALDEVIALIRRRRPSTSPAT